MLIPRGSLLYENVQDTDKLLSAMSVFVLKNENVDEFDALLEDQGGLGESSYFAPSKRGSSREIEIGVRHSHDVGANKEKNRNWRGRKQRLGSEQHKTAMRDYSSGVKRYDVVW